MGVGGEGNGVYGTLDAGCLSIVGEGSDFCIWGGDFVRALSFLFGNRRVGSLAEGCLDSGEGRLSLSVNLLRLNESFGELFDLGRELLK